MGDRPLAGRRIGVEHEGEAGLAGGSLGGGENLTAAIRIERIGRIEHQAAVGQRGRTGKVSSPPAHLGQIALKAIGWRKETRGDPGAGQFSG